jgi:hypothetical protein
MPNWKKIITSGSDATLQSLTVSTTITANSFKTPTGTSSQYLMADGSVSTLTNPITGTGTTNYLPKFLSSGTVGNSLIYDNGTSVGIGTTTPSSYKLNVNGDTNINGTLTATVKSFIIDHPTKPNKKLQYGVLEGPEHSVYFRGKLTNSRIITLPDHWHALVHEDTITVNLTPIGKKQDLWVETVSDTTITVGSDSDINCFYTVFAERKDIEKLVTEFDK